MNHLSYTSAGVKYPVKMMIDKHVQKMIRKGRLLPYHMQLNITNRCNLKCTFCSCSDIDKTQELSIENIRRIMDKYRTTRAITITGGGEPMMHEDFEQVVIELNSRGIDLGMATNGLLIPQHKSVLHLFDWIRISASAASYYNGLCDVLSNLPPATKWAISYVAGQDTEADRQTLSKILDIVGNRITHCRVVADLLDVDDRVEKLQIAYTGPHTSRIIWQHRQHYIRGRENCRICHLRPVICADGTIQACCSTQYAIPGKERTQPVETCLGEALLKNMIDRQQPINGTVCHRCYYDGYNEMLDIMTGDIGDRRFI